MSYKYIGIYELILHSLSVTLVSHLYDFLISECHETLLKLLIDHG